MRRGNKKGLSTIIATLIIILISIVAVVIVWTVVRSVIVKNAEQIEIGTLTTELEIVSVTQNEQGTNVAVKRNPGDGEISSLIFTITDDDGEIWVFEKEESIEELELKVFVIPEYHGTINSISIAPVFVTESGKEITGTIADTYYKPQFIDGGETCVPDCYDDEEGNYIICQMSENGCGICESCSDGFHCHEGACVADCIKETDCALTQECGPANTKPYCGDDFCGTCNVALGEVCNEQTWTCDVCTPTCLNALGQQMNCGLDLTCHSSCGLCNEQLGQICNPDGQCEIPEFHPINTGTVNSYWPWPEGRMLFDSEELPTSPLVDYFGYYVRFPNNLAMTHLCLYIYDHVTPIDPLTYDMAYVKISEDPTLIEVGDNYEIYETYQGCCQDGWC